MAEPRSLPVPVVLGLVLHAIAWRRFDADAPRASSCRCSRHNATTDSSGTRSSGGSRYERHRYTYNVSPRRADDCDHPAADAGLGVADRGRRPGAGPGSPASRTGSGAPRPRRRRAAVDRAARRVGARRLPQFDAIWGGQADGLPGYLGLVHRNRKLGFDLQRIAADGGPVCCEVITNVLQARSPGARPPVVDAGPHRADLRRARGGCSGRGRAAPRREPPLTAPRLSPLALPDLPEDIGRRLVEEHLLDPERFWPPVPPPSVSADEPSLRRNDRGLCAQALLARADVDQRGMAGVAGPGAPGLRRAGARAARRLGAAVAAEGCASTTTPTPGAGMGATDFGWSSLIVEIVEPDPRARDSFLGAGSSANPGPGGPGQPGRPAPR